MDVQSWKWKQGDREDWRGRIGSAHYARGTLETRAIFSQPMIVVVEHKNL